MQAILGMDSAWTGKEPSGVALIHGEADSWSVVCVAPSYESFVSATAGNPVNWGAKRFHGTKPDIFQLIAAAKALTPGELSVVAIDMPVSKGPIINRRAADRVISKVFGAQGCSTHSPNKARPGPLGADIMKQLTAAGFPLETDSVFPLATPCTIEVYPHPALLRLLCCDFRLPYKVAKSSKYWRGESIQRRISNLLNEFRRIVHTLQDVLGPLTFELPTEVNTRTLSNLKRYEDALDALICAWVGLQFLKGNAVAYGDRSAAIWVPK